MIHYYYGNGKGKTSSAVGACVRALGAGMRCAFVQFHKNGSSSEISMLEKLGADIYICPECTKFFGKMNDSEKETLTARHNENISAVSAGEYDMIVLDELGDAADRGAVDISAVTALLENERCEFIVTGHRPTDIFMQRADYITEFNCAAHPYRKGVTARKGIEY